MDRKLRTAVRQVTLLSVCLPVCLSVCLPVFAQNTVFFISEKKNPPSIIFKKVRHHLCECVCVCVLISPCLLSFITCSELGSVLLMHAGCCFFFWLGSGWGGSVGFEITGQRRRRSWGGGEGRRQQHQDRTGEKKQSLNLYFTQTRFSDERRTKTCRMQRDGLYFHVSICASCLAQWDKKSCVGCYAGNCATIVFLILHDAQQLG